MEKAIRIIIIIIVTLFIYSFSYAANTARGYQSIDMSSNEPKLGSDPIDVQEAGIKITDYKSDCAKEAWLEKRQKGYQSIYYKFYKLDELRGYIITEPGTYFIYPVSSDNCQQSSITITYESAK